MSRLRPLPEAEPPLVLCCPRRDTIVALSKRAAPAPAGSSMATTTAMTADALLRLPDRDGSYELVRGELRRKMAPNFRHFRTDGRVSRVVGNFVDEHQLGIFGSEGGYLLERDPDTVLIPDLSFVRAERLPPEDEQSGYPPLAPDLAIEILSPSDSALEIEKKVETYLRAGVRLVWVVNPVAQSITVHTPDRVARTLFAGDTLDGGDVLPGFAIPVAALFV